MQMMNSVREQQSSDLAVADMDEIRQDAEHTGNLMDGPCLVLPSACLERFSALCVETQETDGPEIAPLPAENYSLTIQRKGPTVSAAENAEQNPRVCKGSTVKMPHLISERWAFERPTIPKTDSKYVG